MLHHRGICVPSHRSPFRASVLAASVLAAVSFLNTTAFADLESTTKLYRTGKYVECIDSCAKAIASGDVPVDYWLLKIRAEFSTGRYEDALHTYTTGISKNDDSLALRLLGADALESNNQPAAAQALLKKILDLADNEGFRFADVANRVALGETMLRTGGDARQVLTNYFERARRADSTALEPLLAIGALGLTKQDFATAAEAYRAAAKIAPDDPDIQVGLAKSFDQDPEEAAKAVAKALELNPHCVDALLMQADNLIFQEQFAAGSQILANVLTVNTKEPRAWAYLAVVANLTGKKEAEVGARTEALAVWKTNPEVDHLIGAKLSQSYRFADGAAYQQKSLAIDADYLPAKFQLCQDLLRLGKEDEGWKLAAEVFKKDPYNVTAYNLMTLHDEMAKMVTFNTDHFIVHMDIKEGQIYGKRALALLERARQTLTVKYGIELPEKTTVEIFAQQADFAIRTFGLPGGEGFLGVCFGPVVTVASPSAQGNHKSNWEAILWHEFCHTITLTKTHNKMPRWLSEGISVYEERQSNPAWGEQWNSMYREAIIKGDLTPISTMSMAFMKPPDPQHLAFAYFEASMFVEYANKHYGSDAIKRVLSDLGDGIQMNDALAKNMDPLEKLDKEFAAYMAEQAAQLAPKVNWDEPGPEESLDPEKLAKWNSDHPNSFVGLLAMGHQLLEARKWKEAKEPLQKALDLFPRYVGEDSPLVMLAIAQHELGEGQEERDSLARFTTLNADAIEPRLRLLEIVVGEKDWKAVRAASEELIAVNPLIAAPHRSLANAAEELGDRTVAIDERRTLLLMDPLDLAEQHYRLAKLLFAEGEYKSARREIDKSLEEAPRYRAAYTLLLDIKAKMDESAPQTQPSAPVNATQPLPGR